MEEIKEKLWTKEFILLSVINFFVNLVFFLLIVTIAKFAVSEFDASTSMAGLSSSIFIIGALLGRLSGGRIIGQLGSQRTLFYGLLSFLISTIIYFATFHLVLLLAYRLLQGIAVGFLGTATGTIIAQILPAKRRGEGIGYFSLSGILATAVGPYLGLLMLEYFEGFQMIFIFNAILSLLVMLMYFLVKLPDDLSKPLQTKESLNLQNSGFMSKFIEKRALPISIVALFVGLAYSGVLSFITFYTAEIELEKIGGYYFLIYAGVVLLTRPFSGKLLDVHGANIVVYPCLFIFGVGMFFFSYATTSFVFIIAAICIGIGYGNFISIAQAVAVKATSPERMGLATSTFYVLYDLGLGFGPYILGLLVPAFGYRIIFEWMVIVIVLSIIVYYYLYGKKQTAASKALMD